MMPLNMNNEEIISVVNKIDSEFDSTFEKYDLSKYPRDVYNNGKEKLSSLDADSEDIRTSLLWKWGHIGKENYPLSHKKIIDEVVNNWPSFIVDEASSNAESTFNWWCGIFDRGTTYITAAYITHLIHFKKNIPIIDQHNFRAMNHFISMVRPKHVHKKKPSNWGDIVLLQEFMSVVLDKLPNRSIEDLDKFLMMYGKHCVAR